VINGPVPDSLNNILKNFENNNLFRFIVSPETLALGLALNLGKSVVSTEWVLRIDPDDICEDGEPVKKNEQKPTNNTLPVDPDDICEEDEKKNIIPIVPPKEVFILSDSIISPILLTVNVIS
jgi:glycosyltransferase involved in cell wall biosynthesis